MRSIFTKIVLSTLIFFTFVSYIQAKSPHRYVEEIHQNIIEVIKSNQSIYEDKPEEFVDSIAEALSPLVDFRIISRMVMGKYYKQANEEQRVRFAEAFQSSLLTTYSKTLAEFKDECVHNIGTNALIERYEY